MTSGFKGWLTRRSNGLYLLTYNKPVISEVGNTSKLDAYALVGDPVNYNNLCPWSVKIIWGIEDLPVLTSIRVHTYGEVLE